MFSVWPDSESKVETYRDFDNIEDACAYASSFVHKFDGADYRVILHIDNNNGTTIDTYENINSCDL